jgi:hypothetical protein
MWRAAAAGAKSRQVEAGTGLDTGPDGTFVGSSSVRGSALSETAQTPFAVAFPDGEDPRRLPLGRKVQVS